MGVSTIKMPQLGESVTEGTVDRWLKKEGEFVKKDEPLVEVVTDKVNAEIPSPFEGKLLKISVPEGTTVAIGIEIAQIETAGGDGAPAAPAKEPAKPAAAAAPVPAAPQQAPAKAGDREELVRINAVRRQIAEHMVRSVQTSPHVWTMVEVDMTDLVRYREAEKDDYRQRHGLNLTYLPFVAQILCEALHEFPYLNSSWTDDGILLKRYVNLGIAVAVPPDGLIVPVVKDADRLGFTDLVKAITDVTNRARQKQLKTDDVQGGTFTLNNTGATGSIASMPIINQPQAAILTTESIVRRPVVIGEGMTIRSMMNLCMSFDHRILDGYQAGQFVNWIKKRLEDWSPASIKL